MLHRLRSNPVYWFLAKTAALLIVWFLLYEFIINPTEVLDHLLITNVIFFSGLLLRIFGFTPIEQTFEGMRTIGIDGTNGLWIGDSCDGISLFAVFAIIIICFPGPWKKKMWFIPIGILLIHIFNIIRVTALCMIIYYSPQSLAFNHTYTFQILAYALIFFLWIRWINKYSGSYTEKI